MFVGFQKNEHFYSMDIFVDFFLGGGEGGSLLNWTILGSFLKSFVFMFFFFDVFQFQTK